MTNDKIYEELNEFNKRISLLEQVAGLNGEIGGNIGVKLDIVLPEAKIGGLRFNETRVRAVFDLKEDGWYHSRDILFMSARNTKYDNSRDILTEYLSSHAVRKAFARALCPSMDIFGLNLSHLEISLPDQDEGPKKFNGGVACYWMKQPCAVNYSFGSFTHIGEENAGGCAPVFRFVGKEAINVRK
jgi:hypothetical protein